MKEKFPKYTREENRACKLTDNQISEIQSRREKGEIYSSIARDYGITPQAVFYWCLSKEVRKGKSKNKSNPSTTPKEYFLEYRKRKKELHPELSDYEMFSALRYRKENPEEYKKSVSETGKKRWVKYKDRLKKKNKEYQLIHPDKFRGYSKKWRGLHSERAKKLAKESYLRHRDKRLAHNRAKYREKHPIVIRIRK